MDFSCYLKRIPTLAELATDAYHTVINVPFSKFQECGNDFIMIDNQDRCFDELFDEVELIRKMCERRFGIGADGLIVLSKHKDVDFEVTCYASDGRPASVCADGSRCVLAFGAYTGLYDEDTEAVFLTPGGTHRGSQLELGRDLYRVQLNDVDTILVYNRDHYFIRSSSLQHVTFIDSEPSARQVLEMGKTIRNSNNYRKQEAANVVFVRIIDDNTITIRTYDWRGEKEALSSGSAAVAAAIGTQLRCSAGETSINISYTAKSCTQNVITLGGELQISFTIMRPTGQINPKTIVSNISLVGPATQVYHGVFKWKLKNYKCYQV
ncbi:hypothetical protein LSH36_172g00027 [Paralvinella palmiformis]|uniref:Diaminopimelate epimerase n=1 Tax=Paralvinella palmiformis TaxID=53620 RepID=A0AAD9JU96_9ANNE|nr:hypothetical protein LSH36_172g00027 [Paralvinella palmiformis]